MDPLTLALIGVGGAVVAAMAGAGTTHWLSVRAKNDPDGPSIAFGLSIIVIALSRTGKTTFINAFLNEPNADHSKRTEGVKVFKRTLPLPEAPEKFWDIEILDYDGRDPSLLSTTLKDATLSFPPTVLGVIVDAVESDTEPGFDDTRIQEHTDAWDATSLSLLKGNADQIAYTWVYFNKLDCLKEWF